MKAQNQNKLVSAILMTVLGILFLVWKSDVISIAMTVLGVMLIVQVVLNLIHKQYAPCVLKAALGILIIVFGWSFVSITLYIMAAVLLIYGFMQLIEAVKAFPNQTNTAAKIVGFVQPVIDIFIAVCLLFNQCGTIAWVFILSGIFLIVQGILALIDCMTSA